MPKKLVVFASGEGTNFQAIINAILQGDLNVSISALVTDRKQCGAISRAQRSGIPVHVIRQKRGSLDAFTDSLLNLLNSMEPDLIVLAGYLTILPDKIIEAYRYKIVNIHPSLLPCFGGIGMFGMKVHEAVINSGAKFSGCTVHFVDTTVDGGPIIGQAIVEIDDDDTPESLAEKIHAEEHVLLVRCIGEILERRFEVRGKRVVFFNKTSENGDGKL
ncbi:MAG: phosphoribosylglycinamide formyltransferase [Thermoplasmataceae archaeon]